MFPSIAHQEGGSTSIATVHSDIINAHILTRLDGATLASASCTSTELHSLSNNQEIWTDLCHSTWPSTDNPRMRDLISGGPRSFFSRSFPLLISQNCSSISSNPPLELISSVDVHYKGKLIFSKVQETETDSGWFRCSPFRIDLLDPKDMVPTNIDIHHIDDMCKELSEELRLSWILVNPCGKQQAANLSSWKPVLVHRHWLTNDIQVKFTTIISIDEKTDVQCGITVTFGGEMQVREVSLQVEDMDGINLNGKESLGILCSAMEHGERRKGRKNEAKERYEEYVRKMRERKETNLRRERRLDSFCVAVGVSILTCFWFLVLSG